MATGNKYGYGFVDSSYICNRNTFSISAHKKPGEYTAGEIVRCTIQTLNKICRDYKDVTVDKFVLLADKWDYSLGGYYRTHILGGKYKDTRGDGVDKDGRPIYINMKYWESVKDDPGISDKDKDTIYSKAYLNEVKREAKKIIETELSSFGVPCIWVPGWEADDLAYLCSGLLYTEDPGVKPNVLITKDSDQYYSLSPRMDLFKIPTAKSEPKIVTYNEMCQTIPDFLKGRISLYDYHAYKESLGDSHNDVRSVKKPGISVDAAIDRILNGDISVLTDPEQFKINLSTFDIARFPGFDEAKRLVLEVLPKAGRLGSVAEFRTFCMKNKVSGIDDRYFSEFISRFDPRLFSE